MDTDDPILDEHKSKIRDIEFVNPHAVRRKAPEDLIDLAREIQEADNTIKVTAVGKLEIIAEQMRFLRQQAQRVLEDARASHSLNHAHCNFKRIPGHIYHLYDRPNGQTYFSLIAPEEWGIDGPPHKHLGSFRLEHDRSWTPINEIPIKDKALVPLSKLMDGLGAIGYSVGDTPIGYSVGDTPMDHQ